MLAVLVILFDQGIGLTVTMSITEYNHKQFFLFLCMVYT